MTTEEIVARLRSPGTKVPRAELEQVVRRREEFVPLLIAEIEKTTRLGNAADPDDLLPSFALFLLAEMREARARQAIFEFFILDEKTDKDLLGGIIFEDGSRILAAVAHDGPQELRAYLQRDDISRWVRWAALDALVLLAQWNEQPREDVVRFFSELMEKNQFGEDGESWSSLVNACMDLHPRECLPGIKRLFQRGLVDQSIMGNYAAVQEEAECDPEAHRLQFAKWHRPITNAADEVGQWQLFAGDAVPAWTPKAPRISEEPRPMPFVEPCAPSPAPAPSVAGPGVGRNDQCPCGSGKKYKKCCLAR